ncbi:MAG: hypothetical protein H7338_09740 [Candidatus Sericytochromatia bacterium]|nr:hypothetical protein [Candidatus Sericytochromatia bacterium]
MQAINTMEYVVRALRGYTVPWVVPVAKAWEVFDNEGQPRDPQVERQLRTLGSEAALAAGTLAAGHARCLRLIPLSGPAAAAASH